MNYPRRIQALRAILRKKEVDAFVTSHLPNVRYLSGFTGSHALLIITPDASFFITDFRYKDQVRQEVAADKKIFGQGSLTELASKEKIFSSRTTIGFEQDHLTVTQFDELKKFTGTTLLKGLRGTVEDLRSVKDDDEINLIKTAVGITDAVFKKVLGIIKPGVAENDIAAEISYYQRTLGAEKDAFDTIVASGERSALPHGRASSKKIGRNEFVTLDFGCIVQGYHSDMTRTISVGKPTAEMKKVYTTVLDAQKKALESITVNKSAASIDVVARKHIAAKGYGGYFGHSLGHGVGLEIHEHLRLAATSKENLRHGNVVTVEPGIYLPGKFGVRIEDIVVVRNRGCENVTASPKELIVV
ncbi:MAG: Xaa-Pro peptidase family protein [Bacteroidota bacterium]